MNQVVLYSLVTLGAIGCIASVVLYFFAQKFKVEEDPRIDEVDEALPAANCGGCGYAGCRNFAEACVKADTLDDLYCPVGGNEAMQSVADILGLKAVEKAPLVAVVRCNGTPSNSQRVNEYDGVSNCTIAHSLYGGETGCQFSCLGLGDCEVSCDFDAIHIDPITGLPTVIDEKCTACNACVQACPRNIIELRKKNKKDRKIHVSCMNEDMGGIAKKACSVACIGCQKCVKECPFDAIDMLVNLAFIDSNRCKLCRKCVDVCPTNAIHEINFPPKKVKAETKEPKVAAVVASEKTEGAADVNLLDLAKDNQKAKPNNTDTEAAS